MIEKTKYINDLIESKGYISYLEIGLGDGKNFRNVKCDYKVGIDPNLPFDWDTDNEMSIGKMSSDEYFDLYDSKFDLIFIDGLHHSDQVERDIVNAWKRLYKDGIILIHDILPHNEAMTIVPRQQRIWTGDVFKAWHGFVTKYPKIKTKVINETYGIGQIEKSRHKVELGFVSDISFNDYQKWLADDRG